MTMINLDNKVAVAQFGDLEDPTIGEIAKDSGVHWYYFDQTADKDFELEQLYEHYDIVFICMGRKKK